MLQWKPCHVASHPCQWSHFTLPPFPVNNTAQWSVPSYGWEWKDGKKLTLDNVCRSFCGTQKKSWTTLNIYVSLILQEEDIPELEIDIDELLELTDEGQRSRLQVKLYKNSNSVIYMLPKLQSCNTLLLIDTWEHTDCLSCEGIYGINKHKNPCWNQMFAMEIKCAALLMSLSLFFVRSCCRNVGNQRR